MPVAVDLAYPFTGLWRALNSPATRVPSHGTPMYASSFAIDFVPVDESGRSAPVRLTSLLLPESPARFPGYGRSILAPVSGVVVAAQDSERDHAAFRGWPSVRYALSQGRRAAAGWASVAGNHVMIRTPAGAVVVLCHLMQDSVRVRPGQGVEVGQVVAGCGNTGNSTEPHLHLQAISSVDVMSARALPITLMGGLPRSGEVVEAR